MLMLAGCENPGLALRIAFDDPQVAQMITRIELTIAASDQSPLGSQATDVTSNGVRVHSSGGKVVYTLSRPAFNITDGAEILLQPTHASPPAVTIAGRMFTAAGFVGGGAPDEGSSAVSSSSRTSVQVRFRCAYTSCAPLSLVDLATPPSDRAIAQYQGAAGGDKLTPLAVGALGSSSRSTLVLGAQSKKIANYPDGVVYLVDALDFSVLGANAPPFSVGAQAHVTIIGRSADGLGASAAIGDFDGDGAADLAIGATAAERPTTCPSQLAQAIACGPVFCCPGYTCNQMTSTPFCDSSSASFSAAGAVYLFSGAHLEKLPAGSTIDLNNDNDLAAALPIYGAAGQDQLGKAVALGRLNQKSILYAGAPGGAGRVYGIQGGSPLPSPPLTPQFVVAPGSGTPLGPVIFGAQGAEIGKVIAVGRLDATGTSELAIGSAVDGQMQSGTVSLVSGSILSGSTTAIDLSSAPVLRIVGPPLGRIGSALLFESFNGNTLGNLDLVVGAAGSATVYLFDLSNYMAGTAASWAIQMGNYGLAITGPAESGLGSSLASGLLGGDAVEDLLIGAPTDGPDPSRITGAAYLVLGTQLTSLFSSTGAAHLDLVKTPPAEVVYGTSAGDQLGSHVLAGPFDLNDPTHDQTILGADAANGGEGSVYALENTR
jgi:hypothetical protein